jgi:REP element-mobilizing transposase RayT
MSYRQIIYQIVFSTKHREQTINEDHCNDLYKYIWGILRNINCKLYRINGVSDHIHICCDLHPSTALADLVWKVKVGSHKWMDESGLFPDFQGWQNSYSAFTYSVREKHMIINYIKGQKEHHYNETFSDEIRRLLIENEVQFDEKYLL